MSSLLMSNFNRVFKWSVFWMGTGAIVLIAVFAVFVNKLSNEGLGSLPFDMMIFFPQIIAGVGGMLICYEFTEHTIRNKLIVGHSRANIYLANYITVSIVSVIMYAAYMAVMFGMGLTLLDTPNISVTAFAVNALIGVIFVMTSVSLVVFLCMLMQSLTAIVMSMIVIFVSMIFTMFSQAFPDSTYTKVLDIVLPTSAVTKLNIYEIADNIEPSVGGMIVFCALVTFIGVKLFSQKSDIK